MMCENCFINVDARSGLCSKGSGGLDRGEHVPIFVGWWQMGFWIGPGLLKEEGYC